MQKKQTKKHQKAINDFKTNKCGYLYNICFYWFYCFTYFKFLILMINVIA